MRNRLISLMLPRLFVLTVSLTAIFLFIIHEGSASNDFYYEGELRFPLEIVDVNVNKDPAVGVPFEIRVKVASIPPLDNVKLFINPPEGVEILSEDKSSIFDLTGNSYFDEVYSLVVNDPGEWIIGISVSHESVDLGVLSDYESVEVISEVGTGTFLRQEEIVLVLANSYTPQSNSQSSVRSTSNQMIAPTLQAGEIQLRGHIRYESVQYDGDLDRNGVRDDDFPNGDQPLRRAVIELWDRHPDGNRFLTGTHINDDGNYVFSPIANRSDIDLYLVIYASDDERVRVRNHLNEYIYVEVDYTGSTADGIHIFDHTIPISPPGSGAPIEQAFYVFDLLANMGYNFMEERVSWGDNRILDVHWPKHCILGKGGACYRGDIYLEEPDAKSPDVILHEYGHFVLTKYIGSLDVITACITQGFKHRMWRESNDTCAWSEGWADFFQMAVQTDPDYEGSDLEDVDNRLANVQRLGGNPRAYEGLVAAVLWDLFDDVNPAENFDRLHDEWDGPSQNGLWTYSSSSQPPLHRHPLSIYEFWDAWRINRPDDACFGSAILQHHLLDYPPYMYTLDYDFDASHGNVLIAPGPNCPEQTYLEGTTVELEAIPDSGYVFDTWEIIAGGTEPIPPVDMEQPLLILTMNQDWTVTANFIVEPTPTPTPTPSPTPSPTTITLTITHGDHDAGPNPDQGCQDSTSWNEVYFGECFNGVDITSGFLFENVQIPSNSIITDAFLRFTTNGPYSNSLNLRIYGEASANPDPFSNSDMPANRPWTSAYVDWSIPATDVWGLGYERNTPDLSPIVQEIIDPVNLNWNPGNNIAFLFTDNGDEGGLHRRVIGYERSKTTYTGHLAELVITYRPAVPTPTPSPSPTATEDPGGGEPGEGCSCAISCQSESGSASLSNPVYTAVSRLASLVALEFTPWEMIEILQSLRDEIMDKTEEGQHYVDLYVEHSPELSVIFFEHDDVWQEGLATIDLFLPAFEAMLDGQANEVYITALQIVAVEEFLQLLHSYASLDLQQVIDTELVTLGLSDLEGKSFAEAQGVLLGNFPPVVTIGGPYVVDEGSDLVLTATADDFDNEELEYVWDLNGDGMYETEGQEVLFSAASLDGPSVSEIRVQVCDTREGCAIESGSVSIRNITPEVSLGPDRQAYEGSRLILEVQAIDPGIADTYMITWDLGDGTTKMQVFDLIHSYEDEGIYTVSVEVCDDDGDCGTDELTINVLNATPEVFAGWDATVIEGTQLSVSGSCTDTGSSDMLNGTVYYGDSPESQTLVIHPDGSFTLQHVYLDDGFFTVIVEVCDDDGDCGFDTLDVTVINDPPIVQAGPDVEISEGSLFVGRGTFSDPGEDEWIGMVEYGDGTRPVPLILDGKAFDLSYEYADNGSFEVLVGIADDEGGLGFDSLTVVVVNVAPIVGDIDAPLDPVQVDAPITMSAPFTDPGTDDIHTALWEWGDGNETEGLVTETNGTGVVNGEHAYITPGVYSVTLTVTDNDGDSSTVTYQYIVAFDPEGGFITGGGWIDSPEGAYVEDPSLTGKASFGFVSKYKKGANTPTGNTEFRFRAGNLNFHSDSYDWLVVTGSDYARFKGTGTINGEGEYKFMIWAGDKETDTFRVKIWEEDELGVETVIYDNGMDQEIGGGNIVIHTN